jgi:hypothetical protein
MALTISILPLMDRATWQSKSNVANQTYLSRYPRPVIRVVIRVLSRYPRLLSAPTERVKEKQAKRQRCAEKFAKAARTRAALGLSSRRQNQTGSPSCEQ